MRLLKPRWVMICKTSIQRKNAFKRNLLVVDFVLYLSSQCLFLLRKGVISKIASKNGNLSFGALTIIDAPSLPGSASDI